MGNDLEGEPEEGEEMPDDFWPRWLVTGNACRDFFVGAGVVVILAFCALMAFFVYARIAGW